MLNNIENPHFIALLISAWIINFCVHAYEHVSDCVQLGVQVYVVECVYSTEAGREHRKSSLITLHLFFQTVSPGTGTYMFEVKDRKNLSKYLVSISICSWELVLIIFFRTLSLFSG